MARILVVEDDPTLAEMLVEFLESTGYRASVVPDGARALQYVDLQKPDAIVLDLMLPVITGVEVAKRLRLSPDTWDIPIVAITAIEGPTDLAEVLMVDAVIAKPFDLTEIETTIRSLLSDDPEASSLRSLMSDPSAAPSE